MKLSTVILICMFGINSWAQIKVLQIGDSHTVGPFGASLYESFMSHPRISKTRSIGLASASGFHYASEDRKVRTLSYGFIDRPQMQKSVTKGTVEKLSTTLNSEKPDILVVELGDNFAGYKQNVAGTSAVKAEVDLILKQIDQSKAKPKECYWIGPNWTDKEHGKTYNKSNARARLVGSAIAKALAGKCTFIDSMKVVEKSEAITGQDGLHFNGTPKGIAAGKLWGRRAYEEIAAKSDLLSTPKTTPKKTNPPKTNY